ncbi:phage tail tape measure protein [Fusobacterium nucleatum]|uniref:Phage tail tape measure protein n=1 Tax=Fusobacterium nucleatum subsp. polymorphum TaxID=76857 RepID=A0A2C6AUI7_FUSNP|nr:phage tail tape measure protein [Fusobacterium polymorphum]PHH96977.1 phage tail tape measure protein [Fusobacterium polymorphum]
MKEIGISFGIGAALGVGFTKTFSTASKGISGLNQEIIKLQRTQKLLEKYDGDKKALKEKIEVIKKTKLAIAELKTSMKDEKNQTAENAKALQNLEKKLNSLNSSYSTELKHVRETAKVLRDKKVDISNTAKTYKELQKEIDRASEASKKFAKAESSKKVADRFSKIGGTSMKAGAAGLGLMYKPVQQAINAESNFAAVKKQFDFKDKDEEENFKKELHKIITEKKIAIGLDELYAAAANAGQTGLNKDEAIQYIELASKMGMAFDMNREEAANAMFNMRNSLNLSYNGLVELTDRINYLGDKTGASAPAITDFVNRIGSIGKVAGFSEKQVAALGASLIEQGMEAEVAATGARKILVALSKGNATTKNQAEVYKSLGIDPVKLAKIAQEDSEKALFMVFNEIKKKSKDEQTAILTQLFGQEGLDAGSKFLNNMDKLKENLNKVNGEEAKGSVDKEADIKRGTTENQLAITMGKLSIAGSQLGALLLPEINKIITSFSNLLTKITEFQQLHPEGFKTFMKIFGYGSVALLGFGSALKIISGGINMYSNYMKVAGFMTEHKFGTKIFSVGKKLIGGVGKIAKGFKALSLTVLASPVTWIIAGILALVAAGYLLYKNWDTVKAKAAELKDKVVGLIDKFWFFMGPLGWIVKAGMTVYRNWDTIKQKAGELKDKIANMVTNILLKWDNFKAATKEILGNVFKWMEDKWNSIKEVGAAVADFFTGIFDKIKSGFDTVVGWGKKLLFIGSDEKKAPPGRRGYSTQPNVKTYSYGGRGDIPKYALGGIVNSPTLAWVGEGGNSESIIPHDNSQRSLNLWEKTGRLIGAYESSNNSSSFTFTYSPVIYANDSQNIDNTLKKNKDEAFDEFKNMMKKYERENIRRGNGR